MHAARRDDADAERLYAALSEGGEVRMPLQETFWSPRFAMFSDRFGTEIVLAREEPEGVVYPIAAVAQHWPDATPGWFLRHLTTVLQGLAPGPRPAAS